MLVVDGVGAGSEVEAIWFLGLSASMAAGLEMPWVGERYPTQSALS